MTPKIYCFVNSGHGTDWQCGMAMAEDGTCLAEHVSSHVEWAKHDLGIGSDWKHDAYRAHYPDGYELVWLDEAELKQPGGHPGLMAAYALNQAKRSAVSS